MVAWTNQILMNWKPCRKNARWSYDLWLPRSPELAVDIPFVQTQVHQASRAVYAVDTVAVEIEGKNPADRLGRYDEFMAGNFLFFDLTWTSAFCTRKVIQIGIAKIMGHSFLLFRGEIDRLQITAGGSSDDPTKTALMVSFCRCPWAKKCFACTMIVEVLGNTMRQVLRSCWEAKNFQDNSDMQWCRFSTQLTSSFKDISRANSPPIDDGDQGKPFKRLNYWLSRLVIRDFIWIATKISPSLADVVLAFPPLGVRCPDFSGVWLEPQNLGPRLRDWAHGFHLRLSDSRLCIEVSGDSDRRQKGRSKWKLQL